jgi:hypothetical protein
VGSTFQTRIIYSFGIRQTNLPGELVFAKSELTIKQLYIHFYLTFPAHIGFQFRTISTDYQQIGHRPPKTTFYAPAANLDQFVTSSLSLANS